MRKIIHIDMDAFFASVEQRDHPAYRGKPVIVGGNPAARGVVAAASYEARKFGIHSAMPSSQAIRLCPDAIFAKPRFDIYKQVSGQIRSIFLDFTDLVEPLSLDEAYLDVTENHAGNPSATLIAREIRQKIREATHLTASAGVASNKFLAKMASGLNKPDGLTVITPEEAEAFIEKLPIGEFYGIGKATEAKMHHLGIKTGADLKKWSRTELRQHFGKVASFYYGIARGRDNREVQSDRLRKSVGAENTFSQDLDDVEEMIVRLGQIAEKVSLRLIQAEAYGKTITLKVRYDNFESVTRSVTLPEFVNDAPALGKLAARLVNETEAGSRKVRLLGICVSNLNLSVKAPGHQLSLNFKEVPRPLKPN
ncbi:MAG: DNA polymerase IV [Balneolales bacterium]